jgi:serine/threonine-protein kinase HipA
MGCSRRYPPFDPFNSGAGGNVVGSNQKEGYERTVRPGPRFRGRDSGDFEDESQRFTFSPGYLSALRDSRPVLGQLFEDRYPHAIQVGGPICWFTHLLPQGVMRRWRCRLLGLDQNDSFGLLAALGVDLPGAVTLTPTDAALAPRRAEHRPIASVAGDERVLRFSLAGAQWKLSARSLGRGLTTTAASGGTAYIAKFHAPEYPGLPRCEFATMNWARAAGLQIPHFELRNITDFDAIPEGLPTGDGSVFVIERFDRYADACIHMEDFGQILDRPPGEAQYHGVCEEIAAVLHWIAPESANEFLKLTVFNVLCGNGDAHLKNFSVVYRDGRSAELSPAYDLVSTIHYYPDGQETMALSLDGQRRFDSVTAASFDRMIALLGIDTSLGRQTVTEAGRAVVDAWHSKQVQEEFSSAQIARIATHLGRVAL